MANFLAIVDPDHRRRREFCTRAATRIGPLPGLVSGSCASGDFGALWAAGPRAPIASAADDRGAAALWGEAMLQDGTRLDISALRAAWGAPRTDAAAFDGYHAAAVYSTDTGLVLGADLIGMFPVYWWADDEVLLAGSSPELFRLHPAFHPRLDREGLAGILLIMNAVGGRTLLEGVRRLSPGHLLHFRPGERAEEREQYRLPLSDRYFDLPYTAQVEALHDAVGHSVARHVPEGEPLTLSLSGGRDSRLVAGFLGARAGSVTALTFGERNDMEMSCARKVARASGFTHTSLPVAVDAEGEAGERHATWLHCSTGFSSLAHWSSGPRLGAYPPRLVTGYIMDSVVGGSHIHWAYDKSSRSMTFDAFFRRINALGVPEETLRTILGGQSNELVDEAKARIRAIYEGYSPMESQRAWCFDLHNRQRLHVGTSPWLLSFGAWPVLPAVDHEVLAVAGGMPAATIAQRRAQDEIIRRFFPHLAELPLDRNSYDTEPLSPRLRYLIGRHIGYRLAPLEALASRARKNGEERRVNYRLYDFNGPGWQSLRRRAEPHREKLDELFDRARLDEYLPRAGVAMQVKDGIVDVSGRKVLVGLLLWAREYL